MRKLKRITARLILIILLFFFAICCAFYFKSESIHNYLRINSPIDSDLLILEGWLQPKLDQEIINVISLNNYRHILISGNNSMPTIYLYANGQIVIKLQEISTGFRTLTSTLYGTYAKGEYAKCRIYKNDSLMGDFECKKKIKLKFNCFLKGNDSIVYRFYNDAHEKPKHDRNLSILDVSINGNPIDLYNGNTWKFMAGKYSKIDSSSISEQLAKRLISAGIPKDKVTVLNPSANRISKTYNYSSASCQWMKSKNYSDANILSSSFHSRRTLLSYKKAAPELTFGIISLDSKASKTRLFKEFIGNPLLRITPRFILEWNIKKNK